jgi:hypothetical protein
MSDTTLTKAYQLADQLKELAPWTYMDETDIFGVRMPDTGKQYFVSIMGAAGQHYGMAAYEGTEGLMGFWELQQPATWVRPGELLLVPHLMVSFEDCDNVDAPLRNMMKERGIAVGGTYACPEFQQVIPGFFPINLAKPDDKNVRDEGECKEGVCNEGVCNTPLHRDLVTVMEQALHVFERAKADVDLLYPEDADEDTYLVRAMTSEGDEPPQWQDTWWHLVPPKTGFDMFFDVRERNKIAKLPRCKGDMLYAQTLQADIALLPQQVAAPGKMAYFPSMFLLVSKQQGTVLDHELLTPEEGVDAMHARFPDLLIKAILRLKSQPDTIELRHPLFYLMAKKVLHPTKIKIVLLPVLNQVEEVLQSMQENLG